jgi:Cytochrome c oxidase subunit IIa family
MDTSKDEQTPPDDETSSTGVEWAGESKFIPSGAIAFFILLVLLSLVFWYGIYFLMIERT